MMALHHIVQLGTSMSRLWRENHPILGFIVS